MAPFKYPDDGNTMINPASCELLEGYTYEEADLDALAGSIAELGQLHSVKVIEYDDGRRFIVAGCRRWMACKIAGLPMLADIWYGSENDAVLHEFIRAMRIDKTVHRRRG